MATNHLVGIYAWLAICPMWAVVVVLYFFCNVSLLIGRCLIEGKAYDIAWSSKFGSPFLIAAILIGRSYLRLGGQGLSINFQVVVLVVATIIGIGWVAMEYRGNGLRLGTLTDIFHHLFIAPILIFLSTSLFCAMLAMPSNAFFYFLFIFCALGSGWLISVILDQDTHRLDQPRWLEKNKGATLVWGDIKRAWNGRNPLDAFLRVHFPKKEE